MIIPEQLRKPLRQYLEELNIAAFSHRRNEEKEAMATLQYVIDCSKRYYGLPASLVVRRDLGQYILIDWRNGEAVDL